MLFNSLINVFLRSLTLFSKFILIFLIAKHLSVEDVGMFGIITITINFSLYFLGLDFYVYNTRELLSKREEENIANLVKDQFLFHGLIYLLALPALLLLFYFEIMPWGLLIIFYLILIMEHLSAEISRLLFTFSKPILSNIILFFRSGLWVYFIILYLYTEGIDSIKIVLYFWLFGNTISVIIGVPPILKKMKGSKNLTSANWKWILRGIRTSSRFFIGTISLLSLEFVIRNMLKYFTDYNDVGVYTFYYSISNMVQVFISTGVITILQPKIIKFYQQNHVAEYNRILKKMKMQVYFGTSLLGVVASLSIFIILSFIDQSLYWENLIYFYPILLASMLNVFSQVFYLELYIKKFDKEIIVSSILTLVFAALIAMILIPKYGLGGASFTTLLAMIFLFSIRLITRNRRIGLGDKT
jgi:O-antigen/teichoic acid export membrane protein